MRSKPFILEENAISLKEVAIFSSPEPKAHKVNL